jgi:hypothetical protein
MLSKLLRRRDPHAVRVPAGWAQCPACGRLLQPHTPLRIHRMKMPADPTRAKYANSLLVGPPHSDHTVSVGACGRLRCPAQKGLPLGIFRCMRGTEAVIDYS